MKRKYISWEEYEYTVHEIFREIKQSGKKYTMIGSFLRGGLIPAVHLANLLDIHNIMILNKVELITFLHHSPEMMLVVDDISDTGETLRLWQDFDIACLTYKRHTKVVPKFHSVLFENDEWVVFPWEPENSKEKRDRDDGWEGL